MLVSRVIEVQRGNTVGAIRCFLQGLLDEGVADCVFAPVDADSGQEPHPQFVRSREAIATVNPLLPVMRENAASALRQVMALKPQVRVAAVLRPCEVRAVTGLVKRGKINLRRLVIIGMDCLATYDPDFYREVNANHPHDPYWLMHEALRFSRTGQIAPYRYRAACQMCDRPAADYQAADILLGLIGVKARDKILVLADDSNDARFKLHKVTDRQATEREAVEREVVLWRLSKRREEATHHTLKKLGLVDAPPDVIVSRMERCTLCGCCLEACPLATAELGDALGQGREVFAAALAGQAQGLAGCDGCGMCQAHCPEGVPLIAISRALNQQALKGVTYAPGRGAHERVPQGVGVGHAHADVAASVPDASKVEWV